MAAELIVQGGRGLGHSLDKAGRSFDAPTILALMVVIVVIGLLVDLGFATWDRRVRARRGLVPA
jgi:ABC-type nitrate/sulfonate/bicarbonate transport system permease component